jgi:hypothetical protein
MPTDWDTPRSHHTDPDPRATSMIDQVAALVIVVIIAVVGMIVAIGLLI